jgi:hypothetical protein
MGSGLVMTVTQGAGTAELAKTSDCGHIQSFATLATQAGIGRLMKSATPRSEGKYTLGLHAAPPKSGVLCCFANRN